MSLGSPNAGMGLGVGIGGGTGVGAGGRNIGGSYDTNPPFDPYILPNIAARFDAGVASSITTVTGVSQWNDLSGAGNHLKQATTAAQPSYAASTVTFNGTTQFLKATAFTLAQPETVYFVGKQITWASSNAIYDGNTSNTMLLQQKNGAISPDVSQYAGSYGGLLTTWATATQAVIASVFNNASSSIQLNLGAGVTGIIGANNPAGFSLGSNGGNTIFGNISVNEVLIFSSAHTTAQITQVVTFLKAKWGIA